MTDETRQALDELERRIKAWPEMAPPGTYVQATYEGLTIEQVAGMKMYNSGVKRAGLSMLQEIAHIRLTLGDEAGAERD